MVFLPFNYFFFLTFLSFNYDLAINLTPQLLFFIVIFTFIVFKINNFFPFHMKKEKNELFDKVGVFL